MASYRVPDLEEKLSFVMRHSEFNTVRQNILQNAQDKKHGEKRPSSRDIVYELRQSTIARHISLQPSQWSRVKNGAEAINDVQLNLLSKYFDLERGYDPLIWLKPLDVFIKTLTMLNYGTLRKRSEGPGLARLLERLARPGLNNLHVVRTTAALSIQRGIGAPEDARQLTPELRPGDQVQIEIDNIPSFEQLVLLSQDSSGQFTVLAPLKKRAAPSHHGEKMVLPGSAAVYPVGRPFGPYYLYAILTMEALALEQHLNFDTPYPVLSSTQELILLDSVAGLGEENVKIFCLPYEIVR